LRPACTTIPAKLEEYDYTVVVAFCRHIYNWFAFVLFFYNGFAGLVGGVVRVVYSAVIGMLLIFRLDMVAVPEELWFWDFGKKLCVF
jgi:hypothetical protein